MMQPFSSVVRGVRIPLGKTPIANDFRGQEFSPTIQPAISGGVFQLVSELEGREFHRHPTPQKICG
jgi:hypothetical protein